MHIRCITLQNPEAYLIATQYQRVFSTKWNSDHTGKLGIHAIGGDCCPVGIIAVCEVVGVYNNGALDAMFIEDPQKRLGEGVRLAPILADPAAVGPWVWVLRHMRRIGPLEARGSEGGLWDYNG